ncbi:MAG: LysR family transcriptional regulator [Eubacterium sp.]|nr:LysR family transcriptional regulator [Eubacterium sp.]
MDIRVLRYFLVVAKEGSITKAAQRLYITQPTLSRQLHELEEEIGLPLLLRDGRKITLSQEGRLLYRHAEDLVERFRIMEDELQNFSPDAVCGDIYIGSGESEGFRCIARAANSLHAEYPAIRFHFYSSDADTIMERLDFGLLDFGIFVEPAIINKYNSIALPHREEWGLLMRADHPLARKKSVSPQDLDGLPLFLSRQQYSPESTELSRWLKRDSGSLNIVGTFNLLYNVSLLVEEGMGLALCIRFDTHRHTVNNPLLCFRPLDPPLSSGLTFVWRKKELLSDAARLFLDRLLADLD